LPLTNDCVTIRRIVFRRIGLFDKILLFKVKKSFYSWEVFLRIKWFGALVNVKIGVFFRLVVRVSTYSASRIAERLHPTIFYRYTKLSKF
jgi:hypothetical protein